MAITVAELQIDFDGKTTALKSEMKGLEKRVDRFAKRSTKATRKVRAGFTKLRASVAKVGPALTGLLATLGPVFLIAAAKNAAAFGDKIAKTADRLGITTKALQELDFAATQSGVSSGQLESAIGGLSRRLGELRATGLGTLDTLLRDSNAELLEMLKNANGVEDAFGILSEAIMDTESATDQAAIANAAFGRSGLFLINLLKKGRQGLIDYANQAQALGIILDEDLLRRAEEVTDQFDVVSRQLGTTFKQALIDIAPFITSAATNIAGLTANLGFLVSKFRDMNNISLDQLRAQTIDLAAATDEARARVAELEAAGPSMLGRGLAFLLGREDEPPSESAGLALAREQLRAAQAAEDAADAILKARTAKPPPEVVVTETTETDDAALVKARLDAEAAGLGRIIGLQDQLRNARLATSEPLLAEIDLIDQQVAEVQALAVAEGEASDRRQEVLDELRDNRTELSDQLRDETLAQIDLEAQLEDAVAAVAVADFDRAEAILAALAARQAETVGVQETNDAVRDAIADLKPLAGGGGDEEEADVFGIGDSVAGAIERGALRGLDAAFRGEGIDIAETFSQIFGDILLDSMSKILEKLTTQLSDLIDKATEGLGGAFGGEGGIGGGIAAGLTAAIAIGGQILVRELSDTEVKARRANVTSAVTSTQEVRGIVAGPQSLAVAQVSNSIKDAGAEALIEAKIHTELLINLPSRIAAAFGGSSGLPGQAFTTESGPTMG